MLSSFDGNRAPNTVAGQKSSIQSGNIQVVHLEASGGKVPMRACARYSRRMPDFVHALHCVTVDFTKWQDPCGIDSRTGPMVGKLSRAQSHCRQFRALALGFIGTRDHVSQLRKLFSVGVFGTKKPCPSPTERQHSGMFQFQRHFGTGSAIPLFFLHFCFQTFFLNSTATTKKDMSLPQTALRVSFQEVWQYLLRRFGGRLSESVQVQRPFCARF